MGSCFKRGNVWWVQYYRSGRKLRETSGSKKKSDALRLLHLREGDVARGVPVAPKMGRVRFSELAQDVVDDYIINGKRSLPDLQRRFDLHILPVFGHLRAAQIDASHMLRFVKARQEAGASNGEINRELTAIKRAFNLGIQTGKLLAKPHIATLKESSPRAGFFSRREFERVQALMPDVLHPLLTFMYVTGWRSGEVFNLHWSQVDFKNGRVHLAPGATKNDEARQFPFTQELGAALARQRTCTDRVQRRQKKIIPWVFHRQGRRVKSIRTSWENSCRKAGVPGRLVHDLRRTAVRNLVRAGVPERVAMTLSGHKTRSVFDRYNIVSESDLTNAAKQLDCLQVDPL